MKPDQMPSPFPFLAVAILALLAGLWAGLMRLGWTLPPITPNLVLMHGPLMVTGFLATLIILERAVALKLRWTYLPPIMAGIGGLSTILFQSSKFGPILMTVAGLGGIAILGEITRREPALHTITMLLGMIALFVGNLLWLFGKPIFQIVFIWQAFLILTIIGERLELNRVLRPSRTQRILFIAILTVLVSGTIYAFFNNQIGSRLIGTSFTLIAIWSVRFDIAWRNLRHKLPLTRYIAWCLALGFFWLGISGVLNVFYGGQIAGPKYDAIVHAVFVGFVISMIFGHAPIIFPAILGVPVFFQPVFYLQLALLHISLILRVYGDLTNNQILRMWGGLLNEIAILLFFGLTIYHVRKNLIKKSKVTS